MDYRLPKCLSISLRVISDWKLQSWRNKFWAIVRIWKPKASSLISFSKREKDVWRVLQQLLLSHGQPGWMRLILPAWLVCLSIHHLPNWPSENYTPQKDTYLGRGGRALGQQNSTAAFSGADFPNVTYIYFLTNTQNNRLARVGILKDSL